MRYSHTNTPKARRHIKVEIKRRKKINKVANMTQKKSGQQLHNKIEFKFQ